MALKQPKRKIEADKGTIPQANDRPVPQEKINQMIKEVEVLEDFLGSYESPMSGEIFCHFRFEGWDKSDKSF